MRVRWTGIDARQQSSTISATSGGTKIETKQERRRKNKTTSPRAALYRSLFPIYYLGKTCGLIPVRFFVNATGKCQARLNIVDLVYSFSVLIVLLTAGIWGLWRDLKDGWEHSTRLKSRTAVIATCSDILGVMSLTVVCIVASPFRWKYLQVVINILIEVNEKVEGVVSSAKKSRRFTIILSVCILTYLWLNSCLDFYSWSRKTKANGTMTGKGPVNYAPLYFMYTVIITTEIQYTVSTYNIGQGFVKLNSKLEGLLTWALRKEEENYFGKYSSRKAAATSFGQRSNNTPLRRQFELESSRICPKLYECGMQANGISELIAVHSSLCDAVSLVNNTFGVVILTVTVTCLLHLVITPYFLILQAGERHEWIFLVVQGMWCVFHVTRMMIIVQPSHFAIAEGKRTAVLVSQLLSSSFDSNARRELEIFSLQVLHRPLEFSACGLFSLDRTLITSIAGVVTTYLVILIQFQNADDTKGEVDSIKNATEILKNASSLRNFKNTL